jgi:diguanylate cyclase (GGDEF)-like protein
VCVSLRARLALVLGVVLLGPLAAAAFSVAVVVPRAAAEAGESAATRDAAAVALSLSSRCAAIGDIATQVAGEVLAAARARSGLDVEATVAATRRAVNRHPEVSVVVHDPAGTVKAWSGVPTSDARTAALQAGQSSCSAATAAPEGAPPVLADTVPVALAGSPLVTVVVWAPLDDAAVRRLRANLGVGADVGLVEPRSLVRRPEVVAASGPYDRLRPALGRTGDGVATGTADGRRFALHDAGAGSPYAVLVVAPASDVGLIRTLAIVVVAGALVAAILVRLLVRRLTEPLADLTRTADRLGAGDLAARTSVTGRDEVARLAGALDAMAARLETTISELRAKREVLTDTFDRFGEALGRTHDLDGLLETVVEAAIRGTDGVAGVALISEPAGPEVGLTGTAPLSERVRVVHDDAAGAAADALAPLAVRAAERGELARTPDVAGTGAAIAVPLRGGAGAGGVVGAIAVVRRPGAQPFEDDAVDRAQALAVHAGTAVANVRLHEETRRMSVTDALTGVGNLRHLSTTLSREVERATRFDRPLTVLMLDLDHFKDVNDTHGHAFGDVVLREFAQRLAECLREVDTVARYGGEEFAVILPETDVEGGSIVAERVLEAVRARPFNAGDTEREITASVGVASFPVHGRSAAEVLRAADTALYAAKRAGRDAWRVAGMSPGPVQVSQVGQGHGLA